MHASGDCTHYIYYPNFLFQDLHQGLVPLGELMQESGVPGEEVCRLQVIVHITYFITIYLSS